MLGGCCLHRPHGSVFVVGLSEGAEANDLADWFPATCIFVRITVLEFLTEIDKLRRLLLNFIDEGVA
jgi:hypothetical protein